jgi:YbbR domain-containing protein
MNRAGEALTHVATFVLALVLAIFIWTSASNTEDPIRTQFLEVPLEYIGLPANAALVGADPRQTIQIRLEGPDSVLQQLTTEDFSATVDLSQVPSGQQVTADIDVVALKPGATISFITPEQIDVLIEQQVTREIPVELDVRGSVARGHNQLEPLIEPPTIRVSGPESRVSQLNFALVTIFLNNTVETLVESSQPVFYDQSGRVASVVGLDLSANEVTVTVPVEESAGFADKLVTVEWVGEPAPGYRLLSVTADPPSVLVEGRPAQVNRLASVKTEPIDIDGLTASYQQSAVLDLPAGITVDPEQQTVIVNIEVEPILTTSSFNRIPEARGLREGYQAAVVPEQVRVVLFGPLPVLDALAEDDVRVILDLFGLEPGAYSIVPEVDVPDREIEIRSVQPAAVSVTISPTVTETLALAGPQPLPLAASIPTVAPDVPAAQYPAGAPAVCLLSSTWSISTDLWQVCKGSVAAE